MYPKFLYHKTLAPEGKLIRSEAEEPTGADWHDTPAKFDPNYEPPPPLAVEDGSIPEEAAKRGYVPQRFPQIRYHRHTQADRRVATQDELDALDLDVWLDTPDVAAHDAKAGVDAPAAAASDPSGPAPSQAEAFYAASLTVIVTQLETASPSGLDLAEQFEQANPAGARKSVLKAIKARRAVLKTDAAE